MHSVAAGDNPLDLFHLLMCYSGGTATSHFCCNEQPSIFAAHEAIFCCSSKSILPCEFRIHLTARTIITEEASVMLMFRTLLTVFSTVLATWLLNKMQLSV